MADEELPPVEGEAGADDAPVVDTPNEEITGEEQQVDPIEALASEMGWTPQDQFRGPAEKWKPADEFIRASRDINQNLHREIRSLRDQFGRMESTSARLTEQIVTDKLAERDAYWKRVHAQAVEKDDPALAERAVEERIKIATEAKTTTSAPTNGMPPETAAFIERNKTWWDKDPLAQMRAQEICDQLAKRGVAIPDQLSQAERAIRREFPEHFPAPSKAPASTQTAASRAAATSRGKKGFADMPAESQAMARDYNKRHGIPLEKFAESYWGDMERKVG